MSYILDQESYFRFAEVDAINFQTTSVTLTNPHFGYDIFVYKKLLAR